MSDEARATAVAVLRGLSGAAGATAPLLPSGSPIVGLAVRGVGAALGLVADLLERSADPVVQIETWRSSLSEVSEIDREAEDALRKAGL